MPKLSIIIPTFNSTPTINRCLQSIAAQTFTDYEVVVQDGSPNDDTARAIQKFQESHPDFPIRFHRERDNGVYDAMNRAVAKARGDWLYFLGSDDELYDRNVLTDALATKNTAACDVIYGNVRMIRNSGETHSESLYDGRFDLKKLFRKNICHQAIFYRTEFLRQIGPYNTDYKFLADWDMNFRCWAKTKFRYIDTVVAKFHLGGLSNGGTIDERFYADVADNVLRYFRFSLLNPLVNCPGFVGDGGIRKMQFSKGKLFGLSGRVMRGVLRNVWSN